MPSTARRATPPLVRVVRHAAVAVALAAGAGIARAQQPPPPPPGRPAPAAPVLRPDTVALPAAVPTDTARGPRRTRAAVAPRTGLEPPITPRRAFITSLLVPGLGQTRLQRPTAAAAFTLVELASIAMLRKSIADAREARALRLDSVVVDFPLDPATGLPTGRLTRVTGPFTGDLQKARRLHVEDWIATIVFNHIIAGAEAYVSANLWDVGAQVSVRDDGRGRRALALSVPF